MSQVSRKELNPLILEEAAEWFVEFEGEELTLAQRRAFDEWLRKSPEHVRAFLELLPLWERGAAQHPSRRIDAEAIIARALSADANVIALVERGAGGRWRMASASGTGELPAAARGRRKVYLRAAAVVASVGVALLAWWQLSPSSYSTGTAEQRSVMLTDGSTLQLNARSRVRIRFTERERAIDLIDGQAIFSVAKDSARPFIVRSEGASVRAVGTQFDVYRKKGKLTVTVLQGRVAVVPVEPPGTAGVAAGVAEPILLSAGEQTVVVSRMVGKPRPVDLTLATAWTQRHLAFQKAPLSEVIDEFNRFNTRQMRIEDERTERFLVSATFSSTDPASLLRFLREQPGITVVETGGEIRIAAAP